MLKTGRKSILWYEDFDGLIYGYIITERDKNSMSGIGSTNLIKSTPGMSFDSGNMHSMMLPQLNFCTAKQRSRLT